MLTDELPIQIAIEEIKTKTWGVTRQFLEVHEIEYENGKPKIAGINSNKDEGTAIVYFYVKQQQFYFAVYIDTTPVTAITGVGTEPYSAVYLRANSTLYTFDELCTFTSLAPTRGWNKGDLRKTKIQTESCIFIEASSQPGSFEYKIAQLLNLLKKDAEGTKRLAKIAGGYIQVIMIFHAGNSMLGGPSLSTANMQRMAALELEINFDLHAEGYAFKEDGEG